MQSFESLLPPVPKPIGSYVSAVRSGNLIFTSGALPLEDGKLAFSGKAGDIAAGQAAARLACLNALSAAAHLAGGLERIQRIVKVTGYVNADSDFADQPKIINGASDLLTEIFGEKGRHARAAVGVSSLPLNAMVELELIVETASEPSVNA